MHWQGSCTTWEGDKLLGATPCTCTHGETHTEAHGNEDNLLQKSYTQPRVRLQRLGVCVVEDPVLPGSPRTRRVSQWKSTAAKRSIPEKGPVRMATALPFSSGISEVPSRLPALSGRLQRTGDRDVGSLDGVSDAIRHDCQHDSGTRRQTVREHALASRDTRRVQDSGHQLHHLSTCQCPATKLFSCWGWSCRIKQYIVTSYKWGKKNLSPLFLRKCKIKPIIFNPRQLTNLKFSPIGKKITAWLGFISFSFPPSLHLTFANSKSKVRKNIYI